MLDLEVKIVMEEEFGLSRNSTRYYYLDPILWRFHSIMINRFLTIITV